MNIQDEMVKEYLPENEMLDKLYSHYSSKHSDCEPDYIFYLMVKDYVENKDLLFLRNIYQIHSIREFSKKLLNRNGRFEC